MTVAAVIIAWIVVGILVVGFLYSERCHRAERKRLTNAIIAKNGGELLALEREPRDPKPRPERERAAMLDNPLGL
jgi:hypothetical protein